MKQSNPAITEERIEEFERLHEISLPSDYREFLLEYNGGVPDNLSFTVAKYGNTILDYLFGIDTGHENDNIEKEMLVFKDRVPDSFLPIGRDQLGNLVLIGIKGKYKDKVYFWWHENEGEKKAWLKNIFNVSDSFSAFMASLKTEERSWGKLQDLFDGEDYAKQIELINSGWDVNTPLENFGTAIERVALNGSIDVLKLLIEKGAKFGNALKSALVFNRIEIARELLKAGADPNLVTDKTGTLLMDALVGPKIEFSKLLIEYGADVSIQVGSNSPLSIAEYKLERGVTAIQEIIDLIKSKMQ